MISMNKTFQRMLGDFNGARELVSVNYSFRFKNVHAAKHESELFYDFWVTDVLIARKKIERHFYNFLRHQLFSRLQEIKFYSTVDIRNTRRLTSVSPDCIGSIQLLVRDALHINVYFRSSDIDGALPGDLEFLAGLGQELVEHLEYFKGAAGYEEITDEFLEELREKEVRLNIMFGSLHRTI